MRIGLDRPGFHLNAEAGRCRKSVMSADDFARIDEMLMQMIDIFTNPVLELTGDSDVVDDR